MEPRWVIWAKGVAWGIRPFKVGDMGPWLGGGGGRLWGQDGEFGPRGGVWL